jgi:hypothetical protein
VKIKQNTVGGEIKLNFRICVKNLKPISIPLFMNERNVMISKE